MLAGPAAVLRFRLTWFPPGEDGGLLTFDPKGEFMLLMTVTQKAQLALEPKDARGNPAPLDGVPVWTVANPAVATLTVSPDGLTAEVVAVGLGSTQVNVTADARIGPDVREISGVLDVQISPAEAVTLGITASSPVEQ